MSGVLLWGTDKEGLVKGITPLTSNILKKEDSIKLGPWHTISFLNKSSGWISGKHHEGSSIIITGPCSSSLDLAWILYRSGFFWPGSSILAESQWAGRGQFQRFWHSPSGNLYAAWYLPYPPTSWLKMLSLVVGYCIIQSIKDIGINITLKWPNDLIVAGKKVGGILIEGKNKTLMAGIGINLLSSPPDHQLNDPFALPAISFKSAGFQLRPLSLWQQIIKRGSEVYNEIIYHTSYKKFIFNIEPYLAFIGEKVRVDDHRGSELFEARVLGLDDDGGLILLASGKKKVIPSGRIFPV